MNVPVGAVEVVALLTLELTKLRQGECKHLVVEIFAPELFDRLLRCLQTNGLGGGDYELD